MRTQGPFYSDGSRLDDGSVGAGIAVGDARILAPVSGEQESYRAEMFGLHLINHMTGLHQTAQLDNQAVTKVAETPPMREESDTNLRVPLANAVPRKSMTVEWIKGHRRETEAIDAADKHDIRYNNITDGLAKQAAKLAPQDIVYTSPASISIAGGEVPTPARKWILKLRRQHEVDGVH